MILLYNWLSAINWTPGPDSSNLIKTEKAVPTNPANKAKIRYNVPISLALDDKNHLSNHRDMSLLLVFNLFCWLIVLCSKEHLISLKDNVCITDWIGELVGIDDRYKEVHVYIEFN